MRLFRRLADFDERLRGGCLAVGNFDGVHQGHLRILEALRRRADQVQGPAIVFTFDPHPLALLRPDDAPVPLTWLERKAELLAEHHVDVVLAYPTDQQLLKLSGEAFFHEILVEKLGIAAMVEGPNFRFGHGRGADVARLSELCTSQNITFEMVPALEQAGQYVSSSRIRAWLLEGAVDEANRWLTAPYRLRGMVGRGDQRGRELGFPTANLEKCQTLIPGEGVYAAATWVDGIRFQAAVHIGANVTFGQSERRVEAHLLDFQGDLYDRTLELEFHARLRQGRRFADGQELVEQMKIDVAQVRALTCPL